MVLEHHASRFADFIIVTFKRPRMIKVKDIIFTKKNCRKHDKKYLPKLFLTLLTLHKLLNAFCAGRWFLRVGDLNEPMAVFFAITGNVSATKLEREKFRESKSIGREEKTVESAVGSAISTGNSATIRPMGGSWERAGGRERDTSKDVPIQMSWTFKIFRMLNRPRPGISISLLRPFSRRSIAVGDAHEISN